MRLFFLLLLSSVSFLRAELLPEALRTLPANTTSFEYDNLTRLRQLPNYHDLRKQYSSEVLQRVKRTLLMLGISEEQLSEVVTASGPAGFFGLVAGSFRSELIARKAVAQHFSHTVLEGDQAYCSPANVCVSFSARDHGQAVFGSLEQLRAMMQVREEQMAAIGRDPSFMKVFSGMDMQAPVIGFAPGSEVKQLVKDSIPSELSSRFDLSQWLSGIESVSYSLHLDTSVHLSAKLLCKSGADSKMISNALNAAAGFQRMVALTVGDSLSFRNLAATPSGQIVSLKLDAKLGS